MAPPPGPSPRTAAVLSLLWPGAGQVWLGERLRGGVLMGLWAYLVLLLLLPLPLAPLMVAVWAWASYDAHRTARRLAHRAAQPGEGPYRICRGCGDDLPLDYRMCPGCGARQPPL